MILRCYVDGLDWDLHEMRLDGVATRPRYLPFQGLGGELHFKCVYNSSQYAPGAVKLRIS